MLREDADPRRSVNASSIMMLQRRAIFSGLQIKLGGTASQLGVWCCATLLKLARLCREGQVPVDSIPSLSGWFVKGNRWQLYMIRRQDDDCIVSDLPPYLARCSD